MLRMDDPSGSNWRTSQEEYKVTEAIKLPIIDWRRKEKVKSLSTVIKSDPKLLPPGGK